MIHESILGAFQPNVLFVLVGLITLRLLWRRFGGGLSGIPGPTLAKFTRLWKLHSVWKGDHHRTEIELHQKHGPLVRIGPRHVSVADPAAIPVIYGLNKGFTKVMQTAQDTAPFDSMATDSNNCAAYRQGSTLSNVYPGIRHRK
jgi:hypothetical protein